MTPAEKIKKLNIKGLSKEASADAKDRLDRVAKPLDGLGVMEDIICRLAGIQHSADVDISKRIVVMMCADNGIVDEGISQSSYNVTASVAASMSAGNSSVCRMAERENIDTLPVDIGIRQRDDIETYSELTVGPKGHYRLLRAYPDIAAGTEDFMKRPAMTEEQLYRALCCGIDLVGKLSDMGYRMICTGEMGIGNTTTSAVVASALMHADPERIAGRGAGLDDERMSRKTDVIKNAIDRYGLYDASVYDVMRCVGGYDIAGIAGMYIGGAVYGIQVVIDGLISAAAALCASRIRPGCRDYMFASHAGAEKGTESILSELGLEPVLRTGMKLGEGTGAVMLVPLIDMALAVYDSEITFEKIKVERYERYTKI